MRGEAEPTWWTCSSALGRPAMKEVRSVTGDLLCIRPPVRATTKTRRNGKCTLPVCRPGTRRPAVRPSSARNDCQRILVQGGLDGPQRGALHPAQHRVLGGGPSRQQVQVGGLPRVDRRAGGGQQVGVAGRVVDRAPRSGATWPPRRTGRRPRAGRGARGRRSCRAPAGRARRRPAARRPSGAAAPVAGHPLQGRVGDHHVDVAGRAASRATSPTAKSTGRAEGAGPVDHLGRGVEAGTRAGRPALGEGRR